MGSVKPKLKKLKKSAGVPPSRTKGAAGQERTVTIIRDVTKRKRAEEKLRESEAEYRSLFEDSLLAISQASPDGRLIRANKTYARMYGYESPEQIIAASNNVRQHYAHPKDRKEVLRILDEKGFMEPREFQLIRRDGTQFSALVSARAVKDPNGKLLYYQATHVDLTEQKQAEAALRERDIQFKKLFSWVPGMIYQFTKKPDGTFCVPFTTDAIEGIFGCTPQEVRENFSPIARVIWPEDLDKVLGSIESSAKHLTTWTCEYRVQIPGQSIKWVFGNSTPEKSADGSITWYGFNNDITERKQADDALRESEERFRQLSGLLPQIIFETDIQGNLTFANQHGLKSFGYSPEDSLSGLNILTFVAPEDRDIIGKRVQEIMRGSESAADEFQMIRKDGVVFPALIHATAIHKDGVSIGVRGIGIDITKLKRAEEDLLKMAKGVQEKDEELTRFTTAVLHDLRSPLITIQTFLGFLERDVRSQDGERIEKDLGFIRNAADRIGRLFDEIQRLSQVGVIIHPSQEAPLQEIVHEALDLVAGRIAERGVRVDVTEEPVFLWGDRMRLVEVFQNLVDNAAKFMGDEPAPRIEIGSEQAGDETVLYVRDNGIGIDPQALPTMFALFKKRDPETEGTGAGLALVRRIVELHGGRVWMESEGPGKGTTFRFTLAQTRRHP